MTNDNDRARRPTEPGPEEQGPEEQGPEEQGPEEQGQGDQAMMWNPYGEQQTGPSGQQAQNPFAEAAQNAYGRPVPARDTQPTEAYPPYGPQPPTAPQAKRRGPTPWIAAGAVLVLLVVGGIVGLNIGNAANAPEVQVTAYLDALKKGNAEDALVIAGEDVAKADLLLTDDAYENADDRITRYAIGETSVDGDTATVEATISQAGEKYDQEFTLTRAGREAVIFDTWSLDAPDLGTVAVGVTAPGDAVIEVSGVDASAARSEGVVELRALPGTYPVALAGDAEFYDAEPTSASVLGFGGEPSDAEPLVVALTEEGKQAATDAVDAWLDDCIASTELDPAGCPFSATNSRGYELSNLVWTVTKPVFTIGEYADGVWAVTTETEGEAKATADARDPVTGATGPIFTDPFGFDIAGVIEGFTEDGATFVPSV